MIFQKKLLLKKVQLKNLILNIVKAMIVVAVKNKMKKNLPVAVHVLKNQKPKKNVHVAVVIMKMKITNAVANMIMMKNMNAAVEIMMTTNAATLV